MYETYREYIWNIYGRNRGVYILHMFPYIPYMSHTNTRNIRKICRRYAGYEREIRSNICGRFIWSECFVYITANITYMHCIFHFPYMEHTGSIQEIYGTYTEELRNCTFWIWIMDLLYILVPVCGIYRRYTEHIHQEYGCVYLVYVSIYLVYIYNIPFLTSSIRGICSRCGRIWISYIS